MSRSGSYMKSPEALYKKLNLLGEIYFDLITFCHYKRICVMYLSEFLYPNYGVFGSYKNSAKLPVALILAFPQLAFLFDKPLPPCLIDVCEDS